MKDHPILKFADKYSKHILLACIAMYLLYQLGYALGSAAFRQGI